MGPRHHASGYWGLHCAGGVSVLPQGGQIMLPHAAEHGRQMDPGDLDLHREGVTIEQFRNDPCTRRPTVEYTCSFPEHLRVRRADRVTLQPRSVPLPMMLRVVRYRGHQDHSLVSIY